MLPIETRKEIIGLINREVVPAMGCTEPAAVSLCTAKAVETLGVEPDKIKVLLSPNVLKNAMGVGIPGTDMIGLPIAIALGAIVGKTEYQLEVLRDVTPESVERGRQMIESGRIQVGVKNGNCDTLHIEVQASAKDKNSVAVISGSHTNFIYVALNNETIVDNRKPVSAVEQKEIVDLSLRKVWDFATTTPIDELRFILEARNLNKAVADESLQGEWGHCIGRIV
jgi:L-cysteine desulfidase